MRRAFSVKGGEADCEAEKIPSGYIFDSYIDHRVCAGRSAVSHTDFQRNPFEYGEYGHRSGQPYGGEPEGGSGERYDRAVEQRLQGK